MAKKTVTSVVWTFLLLLIIGSVAIASDFGPFGGGRHRGGRGSDPVSVAEPAAIVLLGAGLVSLGFYAKKKRGKKQ